MQERERWIVTKDGKEHGRFQTESEAAGCVLRHQPSSILYAVNYGGYDIVRISGDGKETFRYSRAWKVPSDLEK